MNCIPNWTQNVDGTDYPVYLIPHSQADAWAQAWTFAKYLDKEWAVRPCDNEFCFVVGCETGRAYALSHTAFNNVEVPEWAWPMVRSQDDTPTNGCGYCGSTRGSVDGGNECMDCGGI